MKGLKLLPNGSKSLRNKFKTVAYPFPHSTGVILALFENQLPKSDFSQVAKNGSFLAPPGTIVQSGDEFKGCIWSI